MAEVSEEKVGLSKSQLARAERNRQKALLLKQAKLINRPYPTSRDDRKAYKTYGRLIDTGGGFLLENDPEEEPVKLPPVVHPPAAPIPSDTLFCMECHKKFMDSYLNTHFDVSVCDNCRDSDEKHSLITRTDAKNQYLLKDCDLDKREPILRFILRKNPHNECWGDMKLYLRLQVEARSKEIWGGEEKMADELEKREDNREKAKQKKFDKKVKELRMAVRSSLWKKDLSSHEHEYGEESYNESLDEYSKTCTSCGHKLSYEKM